MILISPCCNPCLTSVVLWILVLDFIIGLFSKQALLPGCHQKNFNHISTPSLDWKSYTRSCDRMKTCFCIGIGLVNMSASCFSVLQCWSDIISSATSPWIKWNLILMCLEIRMTMYRILGNCNGGAIGTPYHSVIPTLQSANIFLSHTAWHAA